LGFKPVLVVDTFSGDKVKDFLDTVNNPDIGLQVKTFALHASTEVLARRLAARPQDQFRDLAVSKKLNSDVLKIPRPADILLDTSNQTAQQSAEALINALNEDGNSSGGGRGKAPRK
jgi:hypothetical protein